MFMLVMCCILVQRRYESPFSLRQNSRIQVDRVIGPRFMACVIYVLLTTSPKTKSYSGLQNQYKPLTIIPPPQNVRIF